MSVAPEANWSEGRPGSALSREEQLVERELELLDRVIGLEQQVRELQSANLLGPSEAVAIERNLSAMQNSITWRAGRAVTLPIRAARVLKRRFLR